MESESIISKYSLKEKTWVHKGFHGVLFFYFPVSEVGLRNLKEYYGDCYELEIFFFHNNIGEWYWNESDMNRLRTSFIQKVNENPGILKTLKRDWHRKLKDFDDINRIVEETDLSKLSDDKLYALFEQWYKAYLAEYGISIGIQDAFSMQADNFLTPHFQKIFQNAGLSEKFNDLYPVLMSPVTHSFINQEYMDRLAVMKKIKDLKNPTPADMKLLEKHAAKYHWINNNYAKVFHLDAKYFLEKMLEINDRDIKKELAESKVKLKETIAQKKALIKKLKLDQPSKNLIRITEVFADMQDIRKGYVLKANYYMDKFLEEYKTRLGLTREEAEYTYIYELPELMKKRGNLDRSIFSERKRYVGVITTLNSLEVLSGNTAQEVHEKIFEKKETEVNEFKGMIASKGKVTGVVKIVHKIHDLVNVEVGDILVATMTRPEMTPAMQKAAAIITDEGGITSHAAIVSRELGVPCIIGTKIATKVLKDGDKVEVDAEKGIVRIIK